ncbi:MAG: ferritin-like domain-containing protein [Polyangiaceae bacterium]
MLASPRIVRAVMPFIAQGATALALAALVSACECRTDFLVDLTEDEAAALRDQYGDDDLPDAACNELCVPPISISAAADSDPQTAEDAGYAVILCHVVRDVDHPAVICKGYFPENCVGGRRPAHLAPSFADRCAVAKEGAAFAGLARLESASVLAFIELAVELHAHGAPEVLVQRAIRSAVDELRHARSAAKMARLRGATPERAVVAIAPIRTLDELLHDNAVEGLVLESWAARALAVEARTATDPATRRTLSSIARDEASHAALARAIDTWAAPRTSRSARSRARESQREALFGLHAAHPGGPAGGMGLSA